jgi:hypothetical protein
MFSGKIEASMTRRAVDAVDFKARVDHRARGVRTHAAGGNRVVDSAAAFPEILNQISVRSD